MIRDPLYGEIRLLRHDLTGLDGTVHELWQYDPDYTPPLPEGAIRGDIRKQAYCPMCHVPKYFYLDEERTCIQCGQGFTFLAEEQKYWYETLRFHFDSVPIRCVGCRRLRRSEHALRTQIAKARAHLRDAASDPMAHLALTQALIAYHERTNQGDLDAAVAAARKAARIWPSDPEPLYWEGVAQTRAGRSAKARKCFAAVLAHEGSDDRIRRRANSMLLNLKEG